MLRTAAAACGAALVLAFSSVAHAELPVGAQAPLFTAKGARAGKIVTFDLARALRQGPVVLYFYPKAFTQGCTLEAHAFAEANDSFRKAGARVVGMSADGLRTLRRFSTEACRDKFTVAAATPKVIAAYDVDTMRDGKPTGVSKRTSYVIDRQGRIAFVHSDMDYRDHVKLTLAAVQRLSKR